MSLLEKYISNVENAIQKLAIDPKTCRTDQNYKWYLHRGNADIVIFLRESSTFSDNIRYTLVIASPLMHIHPELEIAKRLELQQDLLGVNHKFIMERFSIEDNVIYITNTVFMEDVDSNAISFYLDSLSYYAQAFVEELSLKYSLKKNENTPVA